MSEIKNVGQTLMALNDFKCNHLMPLDFKGLKVKVKLEYGTRLKTVDDKPSVWIVILRQQY